jgi:hypothetical protein
LRDSGFLFLAGSLDDLEIFVAGDCRGVEGDGFGFVSVVLAWRCIGGGDTGRMAV